MAITESILVMEPSRFLVANLQQKIQSLQMGVKEIASLRDLRLINEKDIAQCFAAVVDFSMPDAPNGEHLEFLANFKLPVLGLTGQYGKNARDMIVHRGVVDYFYKSDEKCVQNIKFTLEQLRFIKNRKALIVNDSKMQTFILKKMLNELGLRAQCVATGEEALALIDQDPKILIVFTDYILPGMDGLEFIRQLRQKFSKRTLIVMAMTGTISDDLFAQVFKVGADEVLTKPFKMEELNKRLFRETELLILKNRYKKLMQKYKEQNIRLQNR